MKAALPFFAWLIFFGCSSTPVQNHADLSEQPDLTEHLSALYEKPGKKPDGDRHILQCYEADPSIGFRVLNDDLYGEEQQIPSEWLYDAEGKKYLVHQKPIISSKDIERICVEEDKPLIGGHTLRYVTFSFKPEFWDHIYKATAYSGEKRLALVKENNILLSKSSKLFQLSTGLELYHLNSSELCRQITGGLSRTEKPDVDQIEKEYLSWLEKHVGGDSKNLDVLANLVSRYLKMGIDDCGRTFEPYKSAALNGMSEVPLLFELRSCFHKSKQYEDAIELYNKLLIEHENTNRDPEHEWLDQIKEAHTRCFLGDALYVKGDSRKALVEFDKSLNLIKTATPTFFWSESYKSRVQEYKNKEMKKINTMREIVAKNL